MHLCCYNLCAWKSLKHCLGICVWGYVLEPRAPAKHIQYSELYLIPKLNSASMNISMYAYIQTFVYTHTYAVFVLILSF